MDFGVCKRIRKSGDSSPIIFLSSRDSDTGKENKMRLPAAIANAHPLFSTVG